MNFFWPAARPEAQWVSVGLASSFPDIEPESGSVLQPRLCNAALTPGCKVFSIPKADPSQAAEMPLSTEAENPFFENSTDLGNQVLVFQYKGKFHAIDHNRNLYTKLQLCQQCPHSTYPLSEGAPFDIEDFGVVLSSGVTCMKHGWSFDLFTGNSDRGNYKLGIWEVQLREVASHGHRGSHKDSQDMSPDTDKEDKEVFVRRKQRIG